MFVAKNTRKRGLGHLDDLELPASVTPANALNNTLLMRVSVVLAGGFDLLPLREETNRPFVLLLYLSIRKLYYVSLI